MLETTEERLAKHDEILKDVLASQQEVRNIHTGIQGTLELIFDRLGALERAPVGQVHGGGLLPAPVPAQENRANRMQMVPISPPKWELPSFEGQDPKVWVRKCERYFSLYRTHDDQKVEAAALYLNGATEVWYHSLLLSKGTVTWIEFKEELISRFSEIMTDDVVEKFNKLSQTGSVDEFLGKFEDLKAQMLIRNPILNDAHFLSSFVGALKEEIRYGVKMFNPTTLKCAIEKARMQERAIEAAQRKARAATKSASTMRTGEMNKGAVATAPKPLHLQVEP